MFLVFFRVTKGESGEHLCHPVRAAGKHTSLLADWHKTEGKMSVP